MPTCFIVIGYGERPDPDTQKVSDLDKSYKNNIKPAAEAAGFTVIRSDEIDTPGHISRQMYRLLFEAELVICDLTTLNANALYELGVRMAFRICGRHLRRRSVSLPGGQAPVPSLRRGGGAAGHSPGRGIRRRAGEDRQ